jgi:hypothetical protein
MPRFGLDRQNFLMDNFSAQFAHSLIPDYSIKPAKA